MKVEWVQISGVAGSVAGGVAAIYGAVKGYADGTNLVKDWIEGRRDPRGFRVRTTICKVVIKDDRTEFIKLRTVRANRKVASLKIDHVPIVVQLDGSKQLAAISDDYAVPGRARLINDGEMLQIDLMADEELRAHKDHSVVLGYIMNETRDVLFTPPEVCLLPPVGSDFAVIEVHFPGWLLSLDAHGKADVQFYSKHSKTEKKTIIPWPSNQADVTFAEFDRTWIRAWVKKPQQDSEICLFWAWKCI